MWRVTHAVKSRPFNLVLAGQRGEAVPPQEGWRHMVCWDFVLHRGGHDGHIDTFLYVTLIVSSHRSEVTVCDSE